MRIEDLPLKYQKQAQAKLDKQKNRAIERLNVTNEQSIDKAEKVAQKSDISLVEGTPYRKYGAKKTKVDGIVFDSKKEAKRYIELKALQDCGEIRDLQRQVKFELLPSQVGADGKVKERGVTYKADFTYLKDGNRVVEDVKGLRTSTYILKRKMMLYFHGIEVQEV